VSKTGNYAMLYRWVTQKVRREQREMIPVVTQIANWWSTAHDRWKSLEGFERRKTPLSNHLSALIAPWTADYVL
jgi:hypothetical protein